MTPLRDDATSVPDESVVPSEPATEGAPAARDASLDEAIAGVEQRLSELFQRIRLRWKEFAAMVHPELQPLGYKVLGTLARSGPMHGGALAEHLSTDKSVISRQVRQLEELGLVESRVDERDARARVVAVTPLARERVESVWRRNQEELYGYLRTWPTEDVHKFAELIGRFAELT